MQPARQNLFRHVRVSYRHEVGLLARALGENPSGARLVASFFLNCDAAHSFPICDVLSSLHNLQRLTFFDFELPSLREEARLVAAIPLANLTSLELAIVPVDFVRQALHHCKDRLKVLAIYRVSLASSQGWTQAQEWHMSRLESLSITPVGPISQDVLSVLVLQHACQLRSLALCADGSSSLSAAVEPWSSYQFSTLERLTLRQFSDAVVVQILNSCPRVWRLSLEPAHLQSEAPLASMESDLASAELASVAAAKGRDLACAIPDTVRYLDIDDIRDASVCSSLTASLGDPGRLRGLRRMPRFTAAPRILTPEAAEQWKQDGLQACERRGLRATAAEIAVAFSARQA